MNEAATELPTSPTMPHRNREQRRAGYRRKVKQLRLTFEGSSLDGLVVLMRSVPVATILDLADLAELSTDFTPEGLRNLGQVFGVVADALVSWNLEEETCDAHGVAECEDCPEDAPRTVRPIPADLEGIKSLDLDEALLLVQQWTQAAAGVAAPLGRGSADGRQSAVASLPMEPSSASPPS